MVTFFSFGGGHMSRGNIWEWNSESFHGLQDPPQPWPCPPFVWTSSATLSRMCFCRISAQLSPFHLWLNLDVASSFMANDMSPSPVALSVLVSPPLQLCLLVSAHKKVSSRRAGSLSVCSPMSPRAQASSWLTQDCLVCWLTNFWENGMGFPSPGQRWDGCLYLPNCSCLERHVRVD